MEEKEGVTSACFAGTAARMTHPLLGCAGCLQFFDALFRGEREVAAQTVNGLYPGK
jgi:hypothetical protein